MNCCILTCRNEYWGRLYISLSKLDEINECPKQIRKQKTRQLLIPGKTKKIEEEIQYKQTVLLDSMQKLYRHGPVDETLIIDLSKMMI